jgi:hypothetical protein
MDASSNNFDLDVSPLTARGFNTYSNGASVQQNEHAERLDHPKRKRSRKRKKSSTTIWKAKPKRVKKHQRLHQKQSKALCGIQAINNLLDKKLLIPADVDSIVNILGRGGDNLGNYSAEVLHMAIQKKGYQLRRVPGKEHMWMATQKYGKFLCLGYHLSYCKPAHYIAVDADSQLVVDGARKSLFKNDIGGLLTCLSYGIQKIWKVEPIQPGPYWG